MTACWMNYLKRSESHPQLSADSRSNAGTTACFYFPTQFLPSFLPAHCCGCLCAIELAQRALINSIADSSAYSTLYFGTRTKTRGRLHRRFVGISPPYPREQNGVGRGRAIIAGEKSHQISAKQTMTMSNSASSLFLADRRGGANMVSCSAYDNDEGAPQCIS